MDFSCLEEYVENFRKLVTDFAEAWHLNEDRCRGERRRRAIDHLEGRSTQVFASRAMGRCVQRGSPPHAVWDEHVRDAALKYVARGGVDRKKLTGSLEKGIQKTLAPPGRGKRALKRQRQMETRQSTPAASSSAGGEVNVLPTEDVGSRIRVGWHMVFLSGVWAPIAPEITRTDGRAQIECQGSACVDCV